MFRNASSVWKETNQQLELLGCVCQQCLRDLERSARRDNLAFGYETEGGGVLLHKGQKVTIVAGKQELRPHALTTQKSRKRKKR